MMTRYQQNGIEFDRAEGSATGELGPRVFIGPTDPISDIPVFINYEHHQLHEGETYQYTYGPVALASGGTASISVVVPDLTPTTRTPHIVFELDATGETWTYAYESPTLSSAGTAQILYNRNRNSSNTPQTTINLNPGITSVGTTLLSAWILGAGVNNGGNTREGLEWDLAANKTYLFNAVGKAASNDVVIRVIFYEDKGV